MDLMSVAQELISQKLGSDIDSDAIAKGLKSLFGDENGGLDMSSIMASLGGSGDLTAALGSWLGSGENMPISAETVSSMFNSDQIAGFASNLGLDAGSATSLLADVIPGMVDASSNEGGLLDSLGGAEGALDMAKKFF